MLRPVRPVALVILTACMLYPGVGYLYQGLYPFFTGEWFALVGQQGPWMDLARPLGLPLVAVSLAKAALGGAWLAGVLGLWAGDGRATPLVLLAAVGSLLYPGGGMVMGVIALLCLTFFRERSDAVPA
ncbi:MAG: hypothetical protein HY076_04195 [Candidatus Eisenbacteria bacterium]|uniref:Uncharacterized protein n=1 Tax=Eiseniibacteriota bacterium TaxID=2212470 RepID=A0A9D6QP04_UNCEI|nr:hypothetical protein [Candidatus Eisenbacteria bacterium]MBI3539454.1 hypothetical protein [Candidatus Eisenbacteria bacterium]